MKGTGAACLDRVRPAHAPPAGRAAWASSVVAAALPLLALDPLRRLLEPAARGVTPEGPTPASAVRRAPQHLAGAPPVRRPRGGCARRRLDELRWAAAVGPEVSVLRVRRARVDGRERVPDLV